MIKLHKESNRTIEQLMPKRATSGSAGYDLLADIDKPFLLAPGARALVQCGISLDMPNGIEAQVRPRSGLALKYGVTVLNSPGTIDSDYQGEVCVILFNSSANSCLIEPLQKIAQLVFSRYETIGEDVSTVRSGGFGSTGAMAEGGCA